MTAGTLRLAGIDEDIIYCLAKQLLTDKNVYNKMAKDSNPYGDGKASKYIAKHVLDLF
ncbi:UDP-N-acetylglucosamine 2-epimerase [Metaclostridioides mangenotii]|uniref:UDP-N-acetylglucosamine 2-epimerase n=1 Tax=Metaclostridioides mangenotii TaxID=1540 RepID=UPI002FE52C43